MAKRKEIPDSYFDEEQFLIDPENFEEDRVNGVLGPNPTPDQHLKFELCKLLAGYIKSKGLSNADAGKLVGLDASDVSRLLNFHIDRFTIDRLLKVYSALEPNKNIWKTLAKISNAIDKRIA